MKNFQIKPEIGKIDEYALQEIFSKADVYTKVYWLIDFDIVLKEEQDRQKSKKNKTSKSKLQLIKENYNKHKNIEILINTPCLEVWFLLHYEFTNREFIKCKEVVKQLKKHIPNYEKTQKFYLNISPDIFQKLQNKIKFATQNAKKLGNFDWSSPSKTLAEIYKIID